MGDLSTCWFTKQQNVLSVDFLLITICFQHKGSHNCIEMTIRPLKRSYVWKQCDAMRRAQPIKQSHTVERQSKIIVRLWWNMETDHFLLIGIDKSNDHWIVLFLKRAYAVVLTRISNASYDYALTHRHTRVIPLHSLVGAFLSSLLFQMLTFIPFWFVYNLTGPIHTTVHASSMYKCRRKNGTFLQQPTPKKMRKFKLLQSLTALNSQLTHFGQLSFT